MLCAERRAAEARGDFCADVRSRSLSVTWCPSTGARSLEPNGTGAGSIDLRAARAGSEPPVSSTAGSSASTRQTNRTQDSQSSLPSFTGRRTVWAADQRQRRQHPSLGRGLGGTAPRFVALGESPVPMLESPPSTSSSTPSRGGHMYTRRSQPQPSISVMTTGHGRLSVTTLRASIAARTPRPAKRAIRRYVYRQPTSAGRSHTCPSEGTCGCRRPRHGAAWTTA